MESLEKLREQIRQVANNSLIAEITVDVMESWCDEIQTEVDEKYMLLPVDANGTSIRPGDLMACTAFDTNDFDGKEHVMAVNCDFWVDKDGYTHIPSETRHIKPRTVEDVLDDFARAQGYLYVDHQYKGITDYNKLRAHYASELRMRDEEWAQEI